MRKFSLLNENVSFGGWDGPSIQSILEEIPNSTISLGSVSYITKESDRSEVISIDDVLDNPRPAHYGLSPSMRKYYNLHEDSIFNPIFSFKIDIQMDLNDSGMHEDKDGKTFESWAGYSINADVLFPTLNGVYNTLSKFKKDFHVYIENKENMIKYFSPLVISIYVDLVMRDTFDRSDIIAQTK